MSGASLGDMRLGVIGSGVMAEAIVAGLLADGAVSSATMVCADPREERLAELANRYGVATTANNSEAAGADVLLLAVKPQVLGPVLTELRGKLVRDQLVLSIVAGVESRGIRAALHHDRIIRAMPNTPAQVGAGVTVWFATEAVDSLGRERARALLSALGRELEVVDERQVSMATAVSGSGPAYVFLFIEALASAGVHLGLSRHVARELALETVRGSAEFAARSGAHMAELRDLVTSPAGTTAAALNRLERGALRSVIDEAVSAAFQRTIELEAAGERELGHGPGRPAPA